MIFTEITIVRGTGSQNDDGSIDWSKQPIEKKGLLVQKSDTWSVDLVEQMKLMIASVMGEAYNVWKARKDAN